MKRIVIIGSSGAGKSTFSKALSQRLELPLTHLDHVRWAPNWNERSREEFKQLLDVKMDEGESWILDGNYTDTLPQRLNKADTLIFLDFDRWICTWRVLKRWFLKGSNQEECCPRRFDFKFLKYVFWDYQAIHRKRVLEVKEDYQDKVNWITLKNPKDVRVFLDRQFKKKWSKELY